MATYLGDFVEDETVHFLWTTNDGDGASITRATDGTISVYKDNNATQSTAGITDTEDFDSLTGIHACTIDLSADAFYATGANYSVVLSAATIDGQTVNSVIAHFSIENRFAEVDVVKWLGTAAATPTTAGVPEVDVTHWNATALATTNPLPDAAPDADAGLVTHDKHLAYVQLQCRSDAEITADRSTELTAINADEGTGGGDFAAQGESLEALRDRGDAAWTTGSGTGLTPISTGTAQSATSTTLVLAAGETFANDELNGSILFITGGSTGVGQTRRITNYVGATDTATVATWTTTPTGTITYEIWPGVAGESPTAAEIRTEMDSNSTQLAAIVEDTGTTLPATLATIDGIVDDILVDTGTTLPATLATIDGIVDDILVDTGTTLPATLATIDGIVDDILVDTGTTLPGTLTTIEGKIDTVDGVADAILLDTAEIGAAGAGLTEAGGTGDHLTAIPEVDADVVKISGDATAANNLELYCDGTTPIPANVTQVHDDAAAAANLESACDNYSAERGLAGTALPAAAADAAGGLPISDAGGLDLDAISTAIVGTLSEITGAADIPATPTLKQAIMLLYMYVRNAGQATSAERRVMNDAGTEVLDAAMSDDGTTFDQGELGAP